MMLSQCSVSWVLYSCMAIALVVAIVRLLIVLWWRPIRTCSFMRAQGFKGPPYKLLGLGNGIEIVKLVRQARCKRIPPTNDIIPIAFPYYDLWSKIYGRKLMFWFGSTPVVCIDDVTLAKEVLMNKCGDFGVMKLPETVRDVIGNGLNDLDGKKWALHRKVASPAFGLDSLKEMVGCITEKVGGMVERWAGQGKSERDVYKEFKQLTAEIIGATAFGSNPQQANYVITLLDELVALAVDENSFIPGHRYLPTKKKYRRLELNNDIRRCIRVMIEERRAKMKQERDFLGCILQANEKASSNEVLSTDEIIDECKAFFFSGHETTAAMLSWSTMLLATNPEWQDVARQEVISTFGKDELPEWKSISRLKILGMIFNESLRLYPQAVAVMRKAIRDCKVGNMCIPKEAQVMIPLLPMNYDKSRWGEDADKFNPQRFSEGGPGNTDKFFMPFGHGPRACIGQNLAMLEAKIALATILQRFSFTLSPGYAHSPFVFIMMYPQHGVPILLQKV